jgi:fructose-1-phosphate kinase PfkB-like protein
MMQLSKIVQELNEKDVVVIAIHSSNIDEKPLKEWVKKNNITIPVGMVRGDNEKVRLIWGVQSLPWLILTNNRHLVIDAGFGLNDLDDKIKAANE